MMHDALRLSGGERVDWAGGERVVAFGRTDGDDPGRFSRRRAAVAPF